MKLVTYRLSQHEARLGVIHDDVIVDVEKFGIATGVPFPSTMLEFIDQGPVAVRVLSNLLGDVDEKHLVGTSTPASNAELLAPIPKPPEKCFWHWPQLY